MMMRRMKRTPQQAGEILRKRRERLGLRQGLLVFVSAATARKIEHGTEEAFDAKSLAGYARAVRWPYDAYERLRRGEDPEMFPDMPDPVYDVPDAPTPNPDVLTTIDGKLDRILALLEGRGGKPPRVRHGGGGDPTPTEMPRPSMGRR